jgi:hypothetical protein
MQLTSIAPRLILPDGRIRHILDRIDPIAEYRAVVRPMAPTVQPMAIAATRSPLALSTSDHWFKTAQYLIAQQRQQAMAFSIGFAASIAVVVTALAAQPTSKRNEAATSKPEPAAESRIANFAAPSLTATVRIARISLVSDEQPVLQPTPAFTQAVSPVVAALAEPAPISKVAKAEAPRLVHAAAKPEAPGVRRPAPTAPAKAKPAVQAKPDKPAKVELKTVVASAPDQPSPRLAKAMASRLPPLPSAKSPTPTWGADWSRSALGMNQNGP